MRRSPSRRAEIGVSLFPFLAVLICTMGALIVLLVLVVQQARVQADTISEQRAEQLRAEQQAQRRQQEQAEEDFRWQQEILEQQRRELADQLADRRLQLSHLEDHIRRLDERWRQMQAEVAELQKLGDNRGEQRADAERELAQLKAELDAERSKLAAAREQLARRKRSFTIVPYDGPNGTRRRPIYIECRERGITIQPEGVVLGPQDFAGPLGPGNPLDASLRAIREHWARVEGEATYGEPYPLLIVRPDGAVAYSMARAAMAAWDDEFGYELIDDEKELEFPPSDPHLKRLLEAAIETARHRQALLAAAMPSRFGGISPEGFRISGRNLGNSGFGDDPEGYGPVAGRSGYGSGSGSASDVGRSAIGSRGGYRTSNGSGSRGSSSPSGGVGQFGGPGQVDGNGYAIGSGEVSGGVSNGEAGSTGTPGNPAYGPGFYSTGTGPEANGQRSVMGAGAGDAYAAAGGGRPSGSGTPHGDSGAGTSSGGPGGGAASGTPGGSGSSGTSGGVGGEACEAPGGGGAPSLSMQVGEPESAVQSIARQKGVNWALPNVASGSTGITRPISVECYTDRLVILPDRGDSSEPKTIVIQGSMRSTVQLFVSGVWDHMERWGMAVAGGYWKPVLKVRVAPGADARFYELGALMEESGIEVERREETQ